MSASTSTVAISDKFSVFIDLNTILNKLRSMLEDDSIPMVSKIQAVSNFQTLLDIRMTIISKLLSEENVSGCKSLKRDLDNILDEIKGLLVSEHDDGEVLDRLDELGSFKNNTFIYCFKFDVLKDEISKQIDTVDISIVKLLVSASIYVQKLRSEYIKFAEKNDDLTFSNIVDLINSYYVVINERNNLVKTKGLASSAKCDEYLGLLKRVHDLVNSDASRDDMKSEIGKFALHLIPSSLSTRSMVILVGGVVESNRFSLY